MSGSSTAAKPKRTPLSWQALQLEPIDPGGGWASTFRGSRPTRAAFELSVWVVPVPTKPPKWQGSVTLTTYREHCHSKTTAKAECSGPAEALDLAWFRARAEAAQLHGFAHDAHGKQIGTYLRDWLAS